MGELGSPPPDMVPEHLYQHKTAEKDGARKTHLPQNRVRIGHKPRREQPQREHGQGTEVRQHSKQSMHPLQNHKTDFERKNIRVHHRDSTRCLNKDNTREKNANDAVITSIMLVAVDDFVGGDDHQAGEGGDKGTPLQNPMPADLGGACTELSDGGGPGREEKDGFRHQNCILNI